MASVNKVILVGNVGKDPDVRSANGTTIANFSLATSRKYKTQQGELQEETEWHRVVFFGRMAEVVGQYVRKGSPLYIEGRLRTRKYTDSSNVERLITEVMGESLQMLGGQQAQAQQPQQQYQQPAPQQYQAPQQPQYQQQPQQYQAPQQQQGHWPQPPQDADVPF